MYVSWTDHSAQLTASVAKEVTCEKCQTQYVYAIKRTETGSGVSFYGIDEEGARQRATGRAAENLRDSLDSAFELVPCPNCGAYQAQMVAFLKGSHLIKIALLGGLLIIGATIALIVAFFQASIAVGAASVILIGVGIGLIDFRRRSAARYDPNLGDPEPRKQLGKSLAVLKKDLPDQSEDSASPARRPGVGRRGRR